MRRVFNDCLGNKVIRVLVIIVLSCMALVSVCKGCLNAIELSQDFQWDAARALVETVNPYELSLHPDERISDVGLQEFYELFEKANAPQKMEANQFPSLLWLLVPFTFLKPLSARYIWLILNLLWTVGIIILLRMTFFKNCDRFVYVCLALLMLAGTPYRNQLGVGQHTIFSLFFFLLAVFISEKESGIDNRLCDIFAGVFLAIAAFKYTLTAPLMLYFVYKKRYAPLVYAIVIHISLTVMSAFWLSASPIDMIKQPLMVASALSAEGGLDLGALLGGGTISFVLAGIIALVLFIGMVKLGKNSEKGINNAFITERDTDLTVISVLCLWSLILTYHRTYDFFVLIIPACMYVARDIIFKTDTDANHESASIGSKLLPVMYMILLILVFFVLRIFDENTFSRILTGIVYYIYTMITTWNLLRIMKDE